MISRGCGPPHPGKIPQPNFYGALVGRPSDTEVPSASGASPAWMAPSLRDPGWARHALAPPSLEVPKRVTNQTPGSASSSSALGADAGRQAMPSDPRLGGRAVNVGLAAPSEASPDHDNNLPLRMEPSNWLMEEPKADRAWRPSHAGTVVWASHGIVLDSQGSDDEQVPDPHAAPGTGVPGVTAPRRNPPRQVAANEVFPPTHMSAPSRADPKAYVPQRKPPSGSSSSGSSRPATGADPFLSHRAGRTVRTTGVAAALQRLQLQAGWCNTPGEPPGAAEEARARPARQDGLPVRDRHGQPQVLDDDFQRRSLVAAMFRAQCSRSVPARHHPAP